MSTVNIHNHSPSQSRGTFPQPIFLLVNRRTVNIFVSYSRLTFTSKTFLFKLRLQIAEFNWDQYTQLAVVALAIFAQFSYYFCKHSYVAKRHEMGVVKCIWLSPFDSPVFFMTLVLRGWKSYNPFLHPTPPFSVIFEQSLKPDSNTD